MRNMQKEYRLNLHSTSHVAKGGQALCSFFSKRGLRLTV